MVCGRLGRIRPMRELRNDNAIMNSPGVYIYYRSIDGHPRYIGRSDNDLRSRISHGENEYRYYQYCHCDTAIDAYKKECKLWHEHRNYLDNRNHPDKPEDYTGNCPVCGN